MDGLHSMYRYETISVILVITDIVVTTSLPIAYFWESAQPTDYSVLNNLSFARTMHDFQCRAHGWRILH